MKPKIKAVLSVDKHNKRCFMYYYYEGKQSYYLFSGKYSPSVEKWFYRDRALAEILTYKQGKNPVLGKLVQRIPPMIKYVKTYVVA